MTVEAMSSEYQDSCRIIVEPRKSIHHRRISRSLSASENGETCFEKSIQEMILKKSNMPNPVLKQPGAANAEELRGEGASNRLLLEQCNESQSSPQETERLKELLMLHLDAIQQQQEVLLSKDSQIATLKSENEALKCRLERMERRMSLLKQQQPSTEMDVILVEKTQEKTTRNKISGDSRTNTTNVKAEKHDSCTLKRKSSEAADHHSLNKQFASAVKRKAISRLHSQTLKHNLANSKKASRLLFHKEDTLSQPHKYDSLSHKRDSLALPPKRSPTVTPVSSPYKSCRSHQQNIQTSAQTHHLSLGLLAPVHIKTVGPERGHEEAARIEIERMRSLLKCRPINDHDRILRTKIMYYAAHDVTPVEVLSSPKPVKTSPVETPMFRINPIANSWVLEGTENLEDDIFLVRHQKPETDEKRRKRWDIQRMREQKLYEKLKQGRTGQRVNVASASQHHIESFNPNPHDAMYIDVCAEVAVNGFGYAMPALTACEFNIPWCSVKPTSPTRTIKTRRR